MPSEPALPKKYSLKWATDVVHALEAQYPRASKQVYANYRITTRNVAALLATGDPAFVYLKRRMQFLHNVSTIQQKGPTWVQMYSGEREFMMKFAPESTRGRLDKRLAIVDACRAGSEGEFPTRSNAEGRELPSVLFQFLLFPEEEGADREVFEVRSV